MVAVTGVPTGMNRPALNFPLPDDAVAARQGDSARHGNPARSDVRSQVLICWALRRDHWRGGPGVLVPGVRLRLWRRTDK